MSKLPRKIKENSSIDLYKNELIKQKEKEQNLEKIIQKQKEI